MLQNVNCYVDRFFVNVRKDMKALLRFSRFVNLKSHIICILHLYKKKINIYYKMRKFSLETSYGIATNENVKRGGRLACPKEKTYRHFVAALFPRRRWLFRIACDFETSMMSSRN